MPESPLSRAQDAKRRRNLAGEVAALTGGHNRLIRAPWYPAQAGDQLAITMEATETLPQWTEVYDVTEDGRALRLLSEDAPEGIGGGWYSGAPELYGADPFETPWMEAGADRIAVIRRGSVVHQGRHAAVPDTTPAEPPLVQGFAFTACQFLPLNAHGQQQREAVLNLSVHGRVLYLPEPAAPSGERFELRLDVDDALALPATSSHGHDVHLWTRTPGFPGRWGGSAASGRRRQAGVRRPG